MANLVHFVLMAGRRLGERGLHLHHMEAVEHVEGEIALQRRDAHLLDKYTNVLQRLGRGLDGRRHLGMDWPEAGSDHPAHAKLAVGLAADAPIELDGAGGKRVLAVRPEQLREGERDVANRARHRPDMPEAARRARPDAGHGHAAMGRLH